MTKKVEHKKVSHKKVEQKIIAKKVEKVQHLFRSDRVEQKKLEGYKVVDTKLNPAGLTLMEK